jgi:hypothetical protein
MSEPESIMRPIDEPDKVICISVELLEAYVFLFRTAQLITWGSSMDDFDELNDAVATVIKAGGDVAGGG